MTVQDSTAGRLAALMSLREDDIIKQWAGRATRELRGRFTEAELTRQVRELFGALRGVIESGALSLDSASAGELRAVLSELSRGRARQGASPTETAVSVFTAKAALTTVTEIGGDELPVQDFMAFSQLIEEMGLFTFESYSAAREELIADQAEQLLELSTPVVKLWEGVVAVPLVGTLDSARAQVVMEKLLQTLVDTGSAFAIIDITGVPAVDTQVAQHVLKTVVAARLMGAECIISGIRPQIAQTIVALGIEFGDIATKATLADALLHALRANGIEMVRRAPRREA